MSIKFEIEHIVSSKKHGHYVIARILNPGQKFFVPEKSFLNRVEIKSGIYSPRALDETGAPRFDLFIFHPKIKTDIQQFEVHMIVELIQEKDIQ